MGDITTKDLFETGLKLRREVLGADYVARAFELKDEFSEDVQNYLTTHAWGAVWARRGADGEMTLSKKIRSIMNLAMLAAINRPHELEIHVRGAINNGITKKEMLEIFLHVAPYAGAPALIDAVRIARKVWAEHDAQDKK
ncbi:MAG: 4-carboxymuconolactone decarboxylase [Betaproteobacteria bacterium]|nr:4-carboxymuconolactone decarboxylase [Betaproteobacteria bacterium]